MNVDFVRVVRGSGPLVASAIHDGHDLRPEIASLIRLTEAERLREEDPFTGEWTEVAPTRIIARRSRFEVDLNRPRSGAVYQVPEDSWGLELWSSPLPPHVVAESLALYDQFYAEMESLFSQLVDQHQSVVVLDLHSYNHRRDGPTASPACSDDNPVVNIGTGSLDRQRWGRLVDRLIHDLQTADAFESGLDVRENVRFQGGHWPQWLHQTFRSDVCAIAIEFKKIFMNEWTGTPDTAQVAAIRQALAATVPGLLEERARQ